MLEPLLNQDCLLLLNITLMKKVKNRINLMIVLHSYSNIPSALQSPNTITTTTNQEFHSKYQKQEKLAYYLKKRA
jgi:hypothetical protein